MALTFSGSGLTIGGGVSINSYSIPSGSIQLSFASTQYLTVPSNPIFTLGTNDHTIEFWMYQTSYNAYDSGWTYSAGVSNNQTNYYTFGVGSSPGILLGNGSGWALSFTWTAPSLNAWHHYALVRYGNVFTMYIDGVVVGSGTYSGSITAQVGTMVIGSDYSTTVGVNGYISNFRFTNGYAVYKDKFTPPNQPTTNISYSTGTINGSMQLTAANSQYLTVPYNSAFRVGSNNFTIEGWIYLNATSSTYTVIERRTSGTLAAGDFGLYVTGAKLTFFSYDYNTNGGAILTSSTLSTSTWYHFALVRSGGSGSSATALYINGALAQTATAINFSDSSNTNGLKIGEDVGGSGSRFFFDGYITNIRFVNGSAVYPYGFTVPTQSLTTTSQGATASQVLLLTAQSSAIIDNALAPTTFTNTGPVTYSSTIVPFSGTNSYRFNGSSYLTLANPIQFGTGAFTIELWVYLSSTIGGTQFYILGDSAVFSHALRVAFTNMSTLIVDSDNTSTVTFTLPGTMSTSTWYHVAITRDSNNIMTVWLNGVGSVPKTVSTNYDANTNVIGAVQASDYFNGYFSNLRIVKGTALYTAGFTPPTSALGAITNTVLLLSEYNSSLLTTDISGTSNTIYNNNSVSWSSVTPLTAVTNQLLLNTTNDVNNIVDSSSNNLIVYGNNSPTSSSLNPFY